MVAPPTYLQPPTGSSVTFQDNSRTIASEYVGGFERYPPPGQDPPLEDVVQSSTPVQSSVQSPFFKHTKYLLDRHFSFQDSKEMSLMQAFVNQIGPWMDVVDEMKHVSNC